MVDGVGGVSQQSLTDIFSKIDKAAVHGREVFVNDQGDVRTKGQLKSFFIRLLKPGYQAQQSERIAQAIANAAGRSDRQSGQLIDHKIKLLTSSTQPGHRVDDYTQDGLTPSNNSRLNIVNVLTRANELATTAANKNFTTNIRAGNPGTHELQTSLKTLASIENSIGTLGHDNPVWTGEKGTDYTPSTDTEVPWQFIRDFKRQTTKIQGFEDSSPGRPDNTPEKLQEKLQLFALRAAQGNPSANSNKAAQALSTVLNQALFGSILPTQEEAVYGADKSAWINVIQRSDLLEYSVSLAENGNVRIQAEQKGHVQAINEFTEGDPIGDLSVLDVHAPTHISVGFELSATALFDGEVSVVPGSLQLSRAVHVPG